MPGTPRPGSLIAAYLRKKGIHPTDGCTCYELAREMDRAGPRAILEDLESWTSKMSASVSNWKRQKGRIWHLVPRPPEFAIRELIRWACQESLK